MSKTEELNENEESYDITKILQSDIRLQILFNLFIYGQTSLSELSKKMKKTKATIIYHIDKLEKVKLVDQTSKPEAGSITPITYYSIGKNFIDILSTDPQYFTNKPSESLQKTYIDAIRLNRYFIHLAERFFKQIQQYYLKWENDIEKDPQNINKFDNNFLYFTLRPLSEKGYEKYKDILEEFIMKISNIEKETTMENKHPYMILHTVIPMIDIIQKSFFLS